MQSVLTRSVPSPLSKYLAPEDRSAERLQVTPFIAAASRALLSAEQAPVKPLASFRVDAKSRPETLQKAIARLQVRVNRFASAGPLTVEHKGGVRADGCVAVEALPMDALGASRAARLALLFESRKPDFQALMQLVDECGGSSMDPRILAVALAAAHLPMEGQSLARVCWVLAQALGQDNAALALLSKAEVWLYRVIEDGPRRVDAMHGLAFPFAHLHKASQDAIDRFVAGEHAQRSADIQHLVADCYLCSRPRVNNKNEDAAFRLVFNSRELSTPWNGPPSLLDRLELSHEPTLSALGRVFVENLPRLAAQDAGRFAREVADRAAKCSAGSAGQPYVFFNVLKVLLPPGAEGPAAPSAEQVATIIRSLLPGALSRAAAMQDIRQQRNAPATEEMGFDTGMARALFAHAFSLADPKLRHAALSELVPAYCRDGKDVLVLADELSNPTPAARLAKILQRAFQSPRGVNLYVPPTYLPAAVEKDGK